MGSPQPCYTPFLGISYSLLGRPHCLPHLGPNEALSYLLGYQHPRVGRVTRRWLLLGHLILHPDSSLLVKAGWLPTCQGSVLGCQAELQAGHGQGMPWLFSVSAAGLVVEQPSKVWYPSEVHNGTSTFVSDTRGIGCSLSALAGDTT